MSVNAPAAKLAVSPLLTALEAVRVPHINCEPPDEAVMMANDDTVPQLALAVGKVITALVVTDPAAGAAHLVADVVRA